jgi:hypothetical protein
MKPASLLRWYPRAWRERYGEELLALVQDTLDEGQSSVVLLVMALVNLALGSVTAPARVGQAVRKGRRLRAGAGGATTVSPSAQRTHGRHRA